ncbi:radical SAM/SPASM domain-containing protein [Acetobacterium wieringae]|uniref:radical SAM/SPASM domain-containing protein n=1 Tax=Acetobacterium wieringae TaxID=52694 RepID=UPI0026EC5544|nr:radical SAM protein [Acetobacterium wieringae]
MNVIVNPTYHEVNNDVGKSWEEKQSERYKEYRRKWVNNPQYFILEDAPLHLDIETSSACNLKCPMCPRTIMIQDMSSDFKPCNMELETYKRIIDEAAEIGVYSIKLNWRGEPLIHKDIIEMVRYAKEKGIVDVMFNTNAVLLNNQISKELIEAGLDKLFFSFDSPHRDKYEEIRVGAEYDTTLENIKNFMRIREEFGSANPLTRVSMVRMESNEDEYDEFIKLFKDIVDVVAYVEYNEPVRTDIKVYNPEFACSQLWQRMFIAAEGDVLVCCLDSEKDFIVGNIHEDTLKGIWKNEKYNRIRELHKNGQYNQIKMCAKCSIPERKESGTV